MIVSAIVIVHEYHIVMVAEILFIRTMMTVMIEHVVAIHMYLGGSSDATHSILDKGLVFLQGLEVSTFGLSSHRNDFRL